MARTKRPPVTREDRRTIGSLLRDLRRASGFRSVQEAAASGGCPAARQTIYAYERGGLVPSLGQFLDLVEFYALGTGGGEEAKPEEDRRAQAIAAIARALTLDAYQVSRATELIARLQPPLGPGRRRR